MKLFTRLLACLVLVGVFFVATEKKAAALGPIDLEAGLKVGAGTKPSDFPSTPLGFGLGARAGVNLFSTLYLGGSFMHYFGTSESVLGIDSSINSNLVGAEVGYTITAIPLIQIRPQIGVGDFILHGSASGGGADFSDSKGYLYLEPGVAVLIPLGLLYVGADANALILPSVDVGTDSKAEVAFTIHGQIGVRL